MCYKKDVYINKTKILKMSQFFSENNLKIYSVLFLIYFTYFKHPIIQENFGIRVDFPDIHMLCMRYMMMHKIYGAD